MNGCWMRSLPLRSQSSCCWLGNNSYATGMRDGSGFGLAGVWENWRDPSTGEWVRTFAVITTEANALVADIHDRMPVILRPEDYDRWLGLEPDPRDLLRPFPAEVMRIGPISTRVNSPKNDAPDPLTPVSPISSHTPARGPNPLCVTPFRTADFLMQVSPA
jgi:putative SOS response-associated peptidase YedK